MAVTIPDWLSQREASLRPALDGHSVVVCIGGEPQYVVSAIPAKGKHASRVMQTINGKLLPANGIYPTAEEAIRAGLEELREALGW